MLHYGKKNENTKKKGKRKTRESHLQHNPKTAENNKQKRRTNSGEEKKGRGKVTLTLMPLKHRPQERERERKREEKPKRSTKHTIANERSPREKRQRGAHTHTPTNKATFKLKSGLAPNKTSKSSTRVRKQNRKV